MLVLGSLLALVSGMLNAAAAALEKREGMRAGPGGRGLRLLATLARRRLWAVAIGISVLAWLCEAASLATAPMPVVATLRNAGRGLLVVGGGRWLEERFSRPELLGVAMASLGAVVTAIGAAHTAVSRRPLSNLRELAVGAGCLLAAATVAGAANRLGERRPARGGQAAGVALGTAVGLLFAGTGVFTKELGDRVALYGLGGLGGVAASAGPWLMVAMGIWAQSLIQQAFWRANAATVSAAIASVSSLGLIGAGFALYGEGVPGGASGGLLFGGVAVALAGTVLLLATRPAATGAR